MLREPETAGLEDEEGSATSCPAEAFWDCSASAGQAGDTRLSVGVQFHSVTGWDSPLSLVFLSVSEGLGRALSPPEGFPV